MAFKRLLAAFGIGGPTIDTVLATPHTYPGSFVEGHVELAGGDTDADIEEITLALVARVETGYGEYGEEGEEGEEEAAAAEFARIPVAGPFRLAAGERHSIPFRYPVPWQAPITDAAGGTLPGAVLGLRTDVVLAGSADKGDLDRVHVHALPGQDRILEAFARLGFALKSTGVETGHVPGAAQEFPFVQEIDFHPAERYAHEVSEVEAGFVPDPNGLLVVIGIDRHDGLFADGAEPHGGFRIEHADADRYDWTARLNEWIEHTLAQHRAYGGGYGYGHGGPGHYQGEEDEGGGMLGAIGGAAIGAAGGLAAGYLAAEAVDAFSGAGEDEAQPEEAEEEPQEDEEEE
ncbi:sporulation protein [Nocardiopsis sediminis]|uniref:Sporulation protein n=1 Tax=Nocardiopsis sediminis TaxID=1778267 RepID=A0ABV8FN73_9ACTN